VDYDYTMADMLDFFQRRLDNLHRIGVSDVIIDPGFGFAKTEQQNYAILRQLDTISVLRVPVLVGISRKSMLYKPLEIQPSEVLPATIAANTLALERGAHILRVHDVVAAKQAIAIYSLTHKN
jgi:dihydropteroate synthase